MSLIWLYSFASVSAVSLLSLVGILTIVVSHKYLKGFLLFMVSFSAGGLLGDVFLHLLPEMGSGGALSLISSLYILIGIVAFFILEKVMHWRHCHLSATPQHTHPLATMNLVGDALHNFIDGALIAGSYMISIPVGIATTLAVILHEIPQEMGDFGVLLHAGMTKSRALFFNFLSALTSAIGAFLVLWFGFKSETVAGTLLPITIGGFLYIANSDLIPELHKEVHPMNSIVQLLSLGAGVGVMALLLLLE